MNITPLSFGNGIGPPSPEVLKKIEELKTIKENIEKSEGDLKKKWIQKLIKIFEREIEYLKTYDYKPDSHKVMPDEENYFRYYFHELSFEVGQLPNLDEKIIKLLIGYPTYPYKHPPYTYQLIKTKDKEWILKHFTICANDPDDNVRDSAICELSLISNPFIESAEWDLTPYEKIHRALSSEDKNLLKKVLTKALEDPCFTIRLSAIRGLIIYKDDREIISKIEKIAKEDNHEYVREKAQKLLKEMKTQSNKFF